MLVYCTIKSVVLCLLGYCMALSRCNRSIPCHSSSHIILEHLKVVLGGDATRVSCSSVVCIVNPHLLPMSVSLKTQTLDYTNQSMCISPIMSRSS